MNRGVIVGSVLLLAGLGHYGTASTGGSKETTTTIAAVSPTPSPVPTATQPALSPDKMNVIFIVADDLNDYVQVVGGHPQGYTPNLKRLAARGVTFAEAHANGVICSPSRASFLSGYLPSTSGKYHSTFDFLQHPLLGSAKLLPQHFRDQGYAVYGAGKIFHDTEQDNLVFGTLDPATWPKTRTDMSGGYIGPQSDFGPLPWDGKTLFKGQPYFLIPYGVEGRDWQRNSWGGIELLPGGRWNTDPSLPVAIQEWDNGYGRISQPPTYTAGMNSTYPAGWAYRGFGNFSYVSPTNRSLLSDEQVTNWVAALVRGTAQPDLRFAGTAPIAGRAFMIAMGLVKTHAALYVPDEFYDKVIQVNGIKSIDDVQLAGLYRKRLDNNDTGDIPRDLAYGQGFPRFSQLMTGASEKMMLPDLVHPGLTVTNTPEHLIKSYVLSYLAAIYEEDVQVGKILDALDANPAVRDKTIVVFTSDQGFHLGDKSYYDKGTLWRGSTHVPLIIVDPRQAFDGSRGQTTSIPVSLVDIYPTLIQLTGVAPVPIAVGAPPLDGQSLVPALYSPAAPFMAKTPVAVSSRFALVADTLLSDPSQRDHSILTAGWRYTLGKTGAEELYDEKADPFEWNNVAGDRKLVTTKAGLRAQLVAITHRSP